ATDPDTLQSELTFSLEAGAPAGASINSTNGTFFWTPDESQTGPHTIGVRVDDHGTPNLADTKTFTVTVAPPVRIVSLERDDTILTVSWSAVSGKSYRLRFKTN